MARKPPPPRGPRLELAGDLGVAFVNTAGAKEDNSQQGVGNYAELLAWARAAGVLSTPEAELGHVGPANLVLPHRLRLWIGTWSYGSQTFGSQ